LDEKKGGVTMSAWIPLHATGLVAVDAGPNVTAFPSPFDVPTALRITFLSDKLLKVEFRYLGTDERTREEKVRDAICHLGIHSGRVYAIDLDPTSESVRENVKVLLDALKYLEQHNQRSARNYEAAEQAVTANQSLLLAAAAV
jgi:hypothetical protein